MAVMSYRVENESALRLTSAEEPLLFTLQDVCRRWLALYLLGIGDEPDGRYEITIRFGIEARAWQDSALGGATLEKGLRLMEFCAALDRALECKPQLGEEVRKLTADQAERVRAVLEKEFG